ncbi:hypothetical protein K1719_027586 [Acacia pycnantha]|nr:hypothetical protein K1719_027586 [Acacia pycnantha]
MSSGESRPPNPFAAEYRQCLSTDCGAAPSKRSLVRHPSLMKTKVSEVSAEPEPVIEDCKSEFLPNLHSGACADIGFRSSMEDVYLCVDNFLPNFGPKNHIDGPSAFYGFIVEDKSFPSDIEKIVASAICRIDNAFVDAGLASGTTALAALVIGRTCTPRYHHYPSSLPPPLAPVSRRICLPQMLASPIVDTCLYSLNLVLLFFTLNLFALATSSSLDITLLTGLAIVNLISSFSSLVFGKSSNE